MIPRLIPIQTPFPVSSGYTTHTDQGDFVGAPVFSRADSRLRFALPFGFLSPNKLWATTPTAPPRHDWTPWGDYPGSLPPDTPAPRSPGAINDTPPHPPVKKHDEGHGSGRKNGTYGN